MCVGPPHENISTAIEWIAKKCCTDINNTQRMNPSDFGDPLTFPLASPWQYFIIGWITMTFGTDILVPLRKLNCNNFSDHYFVPHRSWCFKTWFKILSEFFSDIFCLSVALSPDKSLSFTFSLLMLWLQDNSDQSDRNSRCFSKTHREVKWHWE